MKHAEWWSELASMPGWKTLRETELLFISVGSAYLLWLKGLILLSYMTQGKLDHAKHWSDWFIGHILIFMHVGPLTFLTQYIKTTGRKNIFFPQLFALCFLSRSHWRRRDGCSEVVVPQLYQEFILLILRGRAASPVWVSAVLLNKLKKVVCSEEYISSWNLFPLTACASAFSKSELCYISNKEEKWARFLKVLRQLKR